MKSLGIVFLVLGILNLIIAIAGVSAGIEAETIGMKFGAATTFIVLGAYLIHRAKQKAEEEKNKNDWESKE